jgi:hypothetical protein
MYYDNEYTERDWQTDADARERAEYVRDRIEEADGYTDEVDRVLTAALEEEARANRALYEAQRTTRLARINRKEAA